MLTYLGNKLFNPYGQAPALFIGKIKTEKRERIGGIIGILPQLPCLSAEASLMIEEDKRRFCKVIDGPRYVKEGLFLCLYTGKYKLSEEQLI